MTKALILLPSGSRLAGKQGWVARLGHVQSQRAEQNIISTAQAHDIAAIAAAAAPAAVAQPLVDWQEQHDTDTCE